MSHFCPHRQRFSLVLSRPGRLGVLERVLGLRGTGAWDTGVTLRLDLCSSKILSVSDSPHSAAKVSFDSVQKAEPAILNNRAH